MNFDEAKVYAAKLISRKMYTCRELSQKLVKGGCDSETADSVTEAFCLAGIVDDNQYADMYAHDAMCVLQKGGFRVRAELVAKGIAPSVAEAAVLKYEEGSEAVLENYVNIRFGDVEFCDIREIEKAKAHLLRRGFSLSEINRCFKKLGIAVKRGEEN